MSENKADKSTKEKDKSLMDLWQDQMKLIQDRTGIPGIYVLGCLVAAMLFVWIGFLERLITNLVGTVYPAFWTMKSIESKSNDDDDKQWLTYWVVFGCFTIVDMFSGFILKFIPFYFFLKICFLIWLFMPNSQGCHIVYHLLVVRVFRSFEQDIDSATEKIGKYTSHFVEKNNKIVQKVKNKTANGTATHPTKLSGKKETTVVKKETLQKKKKQ